MGKTSVVFKCGSQIRVLPGHYSSRLPIDAWGDVMVRCVYLRIENVIFELRINIVFVIWKTKMAESVVVFSTISM